MPSNAVEHEPDRAAEVVVAAAVDDARDGRLRVEPAPEPHRAERDDDALAREHRRAQRGAHALGRQIEREIGDELEIALAHDLTRQADGEAARRKARRRWTARAGMRGIIGVAS